MSERVVTVEQMAKAFRRFERSDDQVRRLETQYRALSPAMKTDLRTWRQEREVWRRFLLHGPD